MLMAAKGVRSPIHEKSRENADCRNKGTRSNERTVGALDQCPKGWYVSCLVNGVNSVIGIDMRACEISR